MGTARRTEATSRSLQTHSVATHIAKPARRTVRSHALVEIGWYCLSIGLLVTIWELGYFAGWLDAFFFPPPHIFLPILFDTPRFQPFGVGFQGIEDQLSNNFLLLAVSATFLRVAAGLIIGYIAGTVTGFLLHYLKWFGYVGTPILRLMASVSVVAWFPLAIAVLRSGELTAIALVALAIFFPLALSVSEAVRSVPPTLVQVARVIGASRRQVFLDVILPHCLPQLFVLMRLNFFGAWMTILLSELFDVKLGLGLFIFLSRAYLNSDLAWALLVIIGLCGFVVDMILRLIGKQLFWYQAAISATSRI